MSTSEINLRVTGQSSQGGRKYMEDAFVVAYQHTEDKKDLEYAFFGIFDGHGGKEASQYAKNNLLDNIVTFKHFWEDDDESILNAIRDGFLKTHMAMWKEVDNWPKTSSGLPSTAGTTASVVFIRNGKLYTGHVGDSRIVIGLKEPDMETWQAANLTIDHKPETPEEKQRILECGGSVMNKSGVERVVWKRPKPGHEGPVLRSTDFEKIPFLAVARSLGDLWSYDHVNQEFIVSPEPDLGIMNLDPAKDKCLILASDGLWNIMSSEAAVYLVQDVENENRKLISKFGISKDVHLTLCNPSKVLVDCALERWNRLWARADNVSVVTVMIDQTKSSEDEVLQEQLILKMNYPGSLPVWDVGLRAKNASPDEHEDDSDAESASSSSSGEEDENVKSIKDTSCQSCSAVAGSSNESAPSSSKFSGCSSCASINIEGKSNGPLPSCSNFSPEYLNKPTNKFDELTSEKIPCTIPRWSKNPTGRTSLSTLVTWSKMVSSRRMSDPYPHASHNEGPSSQDDAICFSDEDTDDHQCRSGACYGTVHLEENGFERDTCDEEVPCTCDTKPCNSMNSLYIHQPLKTSLDQLCSLKHAMKRKHSTISNENCCELNGDCGNSPKRRAGSNFVKCLNDEANNFTENKCLCPNEACQGTVHLEEMGFDRDTCDEEIPCTCSVVQYHSVDATFDKDNLRMTLNKLCNLKQAIKRKNIFSGTYPCCEDDCELNVDCNNVQRKLSSLNSVLPPSKGSAVQS